MKTKALQKSPFFRNKDRFLSTDFGLKEFNAPSYKERIRRYRRYMYEAGAIDRPDKGKVKIIDPRVLAKERKKDFQITIANRMRYRTRYFTDSGIIEPKEQKNLWLRTTNTSNICLLPNTK